MSEASELAIVTMSLKTNTHEAAVALRRAANEAVGDGAMATFKWNGMKCRAERSNDGGVDYLVVSQER